MSEATFKTTPTGSASPFVQELIGLVIHPDGPKAEELDGELLSLYREFCANRHEVAGMWDGDEPPYLGDPRIDRECDLVDRYLRIVEKLAALPAKTPEGLQAKAAVVLVDFRGEDDLEHYPDQYDPRSALAMSLARDITGRAVG